jgi:hypothetical protein
MEARLKYLNTCETLWLAQPRVASEKGKHEPNIYISDINRQFENRVA